MFFFYLVTDQISQSNAGFLSAFSKCKARKITHEYRMSL